MTQEEALCMAQKIAAGEKILGYIITVHRTEEKVHWTLTDSTAGFMFHGEMLPRSWANSVYSYSWRVE